eukprot:746521-Hanusia_phi.AAC.3
MQVHRSPCSKLRGGGEEETSTWGTDEVRCSLHCYAWDMPDPLNALRLKNLFLLQEPSVKGIPACQHCLETASCGQPASCERS